MRFAADLHIHSHFSLATSRQLAPEHLDYWARLKGISLLGTGDFTHAGWLEELREKLEPAEPGLFRLKPAFRRDAAVPDTGALSPEVRFVLSAEISNIYKKHERVRKVHNVILAPDFDAVERLRRSLLDLGANLSSDGRPIMGLDSHDLLELALEASDRVGFIPAHIWTPWFSVLGSKSGFDSVAECYADLTPHITAVETGLSTDPPMHWICTFLDHFNLVSNSDAHSPEKLGRNANLFDTRLDYFAVLAALKSGDPRRFLGTIDLFPQEGKYHYDGHRKCGVRWDPLETLRHDALCPECGRRVTVGVMHRVAQLADRDDPRLRPNRLPFRSIIPLKELLGEIMGVGAGSRKVDEEYHALIRALGPELYILLDLPIEEMRRTGRGDLAEALHRMRDRRVLIQEGYDGEYGVIRVFRENEDRRSGSQAVLFAGETSDPCVPRRRLINFDMGEYRLRRIQMEAAAPRQMMLDGMEAAPLPDPKPASPLDGLNPEQAAAACHGEGPALIIAGPGTGKTRTLACRIALLIRKRGVAANGILTVTFTNKAAAEMWERLAATLQVKGTVDGPRVATFHAFGYGILREHAGKLGRTPDFTLLDEEDRRHLLETEKDRTRKQTSELAEYISAVKRGDVSGADSEDSDHARGFSEYEFRLRERNLFDLDDCIHQPLRLFENHPEIRDEYRRRYPWILIDEYQDINASQYRMVRDLAPGLDANLCAVGDPDQAIYGFRGADVRYIRQFRQDYPGAARFRLERSYRCSDTILRASERVMAAGEHREGSLRGPREGVRISFVSQASDRSEAEFTARTIEALMGGLRFFSMDSDITTGHEEVDIHSLSEIAVLCRTREQMKPLEKAFHDHAIPYQSVGETPFFRNEPVRSLLDAYRFGINPQNAWLRERLNRQDRASAKRTHEIMERAAEKSPAEALCALIDGPFAASVKDGSGNAFARLLDLARAFGDDQESFLRIVDLGFGPDTYRSELESVALMTLHAAKGLEFTAVFIPGCEDGLLPYSLFERATDREEERRLLYVGMTRARRLLYLSHARRRLLRGRELQLPRSSFLDTIEDDLLRRVEEHRPGPGRTDDQIKLFQGDKS